ncbi:aldo/keto reductase [Brenneria corticis]|uniref:Aldo/keto reductase n=1 Tax=Brenneria corticis TaxID=2173106 RepID=A0A2U1UCZ5_9GAMM|nr:aldo/keto reductase [Brenneria sp. CFCC 11842]PWC19539.1 aldo/keto reductase [Brenneria sp. CFCC 11842]
MKKIKLGRTGPDVSAICLGSMTWGRQNTAREGHAQLDYATERGVNFIDTAELYPVNLVQAETAGVTESIIGDWLSKKQREKYVIATKATGRGQIGLRQGAPITGKILYQTVDASLARLKTDYIDLYQLHVPNRNHYHFRNIWGFTPTNDKDAIIDSMADCLHALAELRRAGKIREFGLSNESSWGMAQWLRLAEQGIGPRPVAIQNEYSLLCRYFDSDLAELAVNESITLLAYSPSAQGLLSGKHRADVVPPHSRRKVNTNLGGRCTPNVWPAIGAWVGLADELNLHPVTFAVAFVMSRHFPAIPIVGATSIDQLKSSLDAVQTSLSEETRRRIDATFKQHPMPF